MIRLFPVVLSVVYAALLYMTGVHNPDDLAVQTSYIAAPWMILIYMIHYKDYGTFGDEFESHRLLIETNWFEKNYMAIMYASASILVVGIAAYNGCPAQHLSDLTAVCLTGMGFSEILTWAIRNWSMWMKNWNCPL